MQTKYFKMKCLEVKITGRLEVDKINLISSRERDVDHTIRTEVIKILLDRTFLDVALVELFVGCARLRPVCQATDLF